MVRNGLIRRGLRSFRRDGVEQRGPAAIRGRVEVHRDGAIAAAFTRDGALDQNTLVPSQVFSADLEVAGLDGLALMWSATTSLGIRSDYVAKIGTTPNTTIFRRRDELNLLVPSDPAEAVLNFRAVEGPVLASLGLEAMLRTGVDLITDVVEQTGSMCTVTADALMLQAELGY
ncbi:hypothetical protein GCM10025868_46940 [Angustibacter aerolatus]|uniref:Aminomethyltransferase folate-binding domain-containing protein n=1 Tax=Angustibacter aerolatus TaxID=1162965 RepID=A0ABQ6JNB5_9ACTN|nr:hypothetical protein GCM10025868_46940 [Angustibacter aerolatus]